jgi:hypothetical protein
MEFIPRTDYTTGAWFLFCHFAKNESETGLLIAIPVSLSFDFGNKPGDREKRPGSSGFRPGCLHNLSQAGI